MSRRHFVNSFDVFEFLGLPKDSRLVGHRHGLHDNKKIEDEYQGDQGDEDPDVVGVQPAHTGHLTLGIQSFPWNMGIERRPKYRLWYPTVDSYHKVHQKEIECQSNELF